ncbi:hypothetical protein Nocox_41420 [Nonomuraea coxensis DSM 45129]|uniref:Secreted protein n=1 Tax=Nonomuraea coxensis DSM 45129 TaxID=1122611 RepID=A0ABX8UDY6_9ACTN|nr:hypothetical protein [Nonomuraea coxensis]QYC45825.1 hypothetical protein Nocox_41420 [Nonomuraea coxensis DSM 45129]
MRGKRQGAIGAPLALLTLLAALFCVTGASLAPSAMAGSATAVTAAHADGGEAHESLGATDETAPAVPAGTRCLKKAQPEQQHPRIGALPARALPVENDALAPARAPTRTGAPRRNPTESPPDLTELSVRRV